MCMVGLLNLLLTNEALTAVFDCRLAAEVGGGGLILYATLAVGRVGRV